MAKKVSVLVVCTGNICRSPTGEGVLRHLAAKRGIGDQVEIRSAGTHNYHVGEAPDARTVRHASKRGYDLSAQRAQLVNPRHFEQYNYILAMDSGHLRILRDMAPASSKARLGMFLEPSARWKGGDVPDPYYGGVQGFEEVLDMVEEAAALWLDRIEAELDPTSRPT